MSENLSALSQNTARPDLNCLTVKDVAAHLKVTPKTVYRLIRKGSLFAKKVGGAVRITEEALSLYLRENSITPPETFKRRSRRVLPVVAAKYRHF